jgi:hypothetical protein
VSSRTSPPKNGVLANEEGSIYGRSVAAHRLVPFDDQSLFRALAGTPLASQGIPGPTREVPSNRKAQSDPSGRGQLFQKVECAELASLQECTFAADSFCSAAPMCEYAVRACRTPGSNPRRLR